MPYVYQEQRPYTLTDEGNRDVVRVFKKAQEICAIAGVVRHDKLTVDLKCGDSWKMIACVDRCVEMGLIREISTTCWATQHKVYELA